MLKKLIRESFFNPALHFVPVFVFLFAEETMGTGAAWVFSLLTIAISGAYVRVVYGSMMQWYLMSIGYYLFITLTSLVLSRQFPEFFLQPLYTELVMLVLLLVLALLALRLAQVDYLSL